MFHILTLPQLQPSPTPLVSCCHIPLRLLTHPSPAPPISTVYTRKKSSTHSTRSPNPHDSRSTSSHTFNIRSRSFFASSLCFAVRSNRAARKHLFTARLASLQFPTALYRNPREWHSSRARITSEQEFVLSLWFGRSVSVCVCLSF